MPSFNSQFIDEAVVSVLAQTLQDWELIIADCSTNPDVLSVLETFDDPRIKLYRREKRYLPGNNRNFAIEKAQTGFILCLDADDLIQPSFIEEALFLIHTTEYDLIGTSCVTFKDVSQQHLLNPHPSIDQVADGGAFVVSTLFPKALWEKLGGFKDTGLGPSHVPEDWDFFVRAMLAGAKPYNRPGFGFTYRRHAQSLTMQPDLPKFSEMRCRIKAKYRLPLLINKLFKQGSAATKKRTVDGWHPLIPALHKEESSIIVWPDANTAEFMERIAEVLGRAEKRTIIVCTQPKHLSPSSSSAFWQQHSSDIFFLPDFLESKDLWLSFIRYLIEAKHASDIYYSQNLFFLDSVETLIDLYPQCRFEYVSKFKNNPADSAAPITQVQV